ncbi:MFS transporter [Agrobacterium sp. ES01]|uniref:MFS transporter n=1 Tax=Agrobacterium sp. ES01 TaxID=3420714 RepID=UPI003D0CABF6
MQTIETNETMAATSGDHGNWRELLQPRYGATTIMLCIGVALYAFNNFLVSTSLPTAVEELGGARLISWSLSLFLASSIVAGAAAPLIKRRFGARFALIGTAFVFLAGTLLAAGAHDMTTVLVGRVLQGVGDGVVVAISYTLIPEMFPSRLVPKVFGAEAMVWGVAAFGGPAVAGYLTEFHSWRAAFYVNVPIVAIFILLALIIVPKHIGDTERGRFPAMRLSLLLASLLIAMSAGLSPSLSISFVALFASAAVLAAAVRLDRKASFSLMPKGAFSLRSTLGLGLWVVLLMPVAQATSGVYLIFALQHLWGLSPFVAGSLSAVMAISWSGSAILVANLKSTHWQQTAIWLGPLLHAAGFFSLFAGVATGTLGLIIPGQILTGSAFGVSWAFLSQTLMEATPKMERDKTSALLPTLQSAGFAFGGAFAGLAANAAGLGDSVTAKAVHLPLTVTFLCAALMAIPGIFAARRAVRASTISHIARQHRSNSVTALSTRLHRDIGLPEDI